MNVTLFLTHQCNLRCRYCYNGAQCERAMPEGVMRRALQLAFQNNGPNEPVVIRFFGGEPLLEQPLIRAAVEHARCLAHEQGASLRFAITTNGTLIDSHVAAWLEAEHFSVTISIDGCRAAHDRYRRFAGGASSHDAVLAGLRTALAQLSSVECAAVIEPDTADYLPDSLEEFLSLGVSALTFIPDYEAHWSEEQFEAFEHSLEGVSARLLECYRQGRSVDVEPWDTKIRAHIEGGYARGPRCPFGQGEIAVAPSGRIYPCDRLVRQDDRPDWVIGCVDRGIDPSRVFEFRTALDRPDPDCGSCALRGRCMHWCGCVNAMTSGHLGRPSHTVCRLQQALISSADRVAERLYAENNQVFMRKFYG